MEEKKEMTKGKPHNPLPGAKDFIKYIGQGLLVTSEKVMGQYKNKIWDKFFLWTIGIVISVLNIMLFRSLL